MLRIQILLFTFFLCTCVLAQSPMAETLKNNLAYVCPPCNSVCDELKFGEAGKCPHCSMTLVHQDSLEPQPEAPTTIAFYLQSGVEVLDFAGPLEVLTYAGFKVFTVSKSLDPIISQGVLKVLPDYSLEDAPEADIIAVFGGNGFNTSQDTAVTNWIRHQENTQLHFSVCTGALILAEAGILDGKTATTFHNTLDYLEESYPKIKVLRDVRYVDNGNVISTAGISAGIDGALHLVAKLKGYNAARATAYNMEYDNWQPADGLLLSSDDPYRQIPAEAVLSEYVGIYEHWNLPELQIRYNARDRGLEAIFRELRFPLYFEAKDVFKDVGGDTVTFERSADGRVIGYRRSYEPDRLMKRL
ncbi:DJ-1/PfpI family protein [Neolewinella persica]|uniref:DJ-1/PfpI family protein n=1 Tax=Neolewinella persica TaxID=70998 RepID=UPI0003A12CBE|nr:DJ-1/PfpI family protein [Neolewinella persica]